MPCPSNKPASIMGVAAVAVSVGQLVSRAYQSLGNSCMLLSQQCLSSNVFPLFGQFLLTSFSNQTFKSLLMAQEVPWFDFLLCDSCLISDENNLFQALCSYFTLPFLPVVLVIIISIRLNLNKKLPASGTDAKLSAE